MALMEYCVVTVVLGDYEFARAVRKSRMVYQDESPNMVGKTSEPARVGSLYVLPIFLFHIDKFSYFL